MVSKQIQTVYEIEALLLLFKNAQSESKKQIEINLLIDQKVKELCRLRNLHVEDKVIVESTDDSSELIAESAQWEEKNLANDSVLNKDQDKEQKKFNTDSSTSQDVRIDNQAEIVADKSDIEDSDCINIVVSAHSFPLTLNDRFRFTRELFNSSSASYDSTIKLLSSFSSIEQVIDYLKDEMRFEMDSQTVKDFVDILSYGFRR